ncbi:hypothetical protein REPUB_Repub19eG0076600 [Reevesia pubescens]
MSALPCYLMQTTSLPDFVTSEIDKLMRTFLWGGTTGNKKMHMISWEKVCLPKEQGGLGLRNTKTINQAFLAKLGWLILQDKESLWIEVMKKKYLKQKDFLSVEAKSSDSYTWKSILKGRNLVKQGIGKNVNNGLSTKFWLEEWLPCGMLINKATRIISEDEAEMNVADYFETNRGWNIERISEALDCDVIDMIMVKWLEKEGNTEDDIFWKAAADGYFTVKSAYSLHNSATSKQEDEWNKIWNLQCPEKIKLFIWKIFHNSLPTLECLAQRNLLTNTVCQRCSIREETTLHALRDCDSSKSIWLNFNQNLLPDNFFSSTLKGWLFSNIEMKKAISGIPWRILFVTAAWYVWYWRNCSLHEQDFTWPGNAQKQIWAKAKQMVDVLDNFCNRLQYAAEIKWEKPPLHAVKINVDGSVSKDTGMAFAGGVIRDNNGEWITGFNYRVGTCNITTAELWGIYQGIILCWNKGYREVELESDSTVAIKKINTAHNQFDTDGSLVGAIQGILQRNWNCKIRHIYREANQCADWMASIQHNVHAGLQVFEDPPHGLRPFLLADTLGVIKISLSLPPSEHIGIVEIAFLSFTVIHCSIEPNFHSPFSLLINSATLLGIGLLTSPG